MGDRNFLEIPSSKPSRVSSCCYSPPSSSSCFSSVLSEKSLELRTESLGNETGCWEIVETNLLSSVPSAMGGPDRPENPPRGFVANKKAGASPRTYPPPLTSICGTESIHFRPHCEHRRLIIEAFRAPMALGNLQAERSHTGGFGSASWRNQIWPPTLSLSTVKKEPKKKRLKEIAFAGKKRRRKWRGRSKTKMLIARAVGRGCRREE